MTEKYSQACYHITLLILLKLLQLTGCFLGIGIFFFLYSDLYLLLFEYDDRKHDVLPGLTLTYFMQDDDLGFNFQTE